MLYEKKVMGFESCLLGTYSDCFFMIHCARKGMEKDGIFFAEFHGN